MQLVTLSLISCSRLSQLALTSGGGGGGDANYRGWRRWRGREERRRRRLCPWYYIGLGPRYHNWDFTLYYQHRVKVWNVTTQDLLPDKGHRYWYSCSIVHSLCRSLNGPTIRDVGSNHTRIIAPGDDERCVSLFCAFNALRATQARARVSCSSIQGSFTQSYA